MFKVVLILLFLTSGLASGLASANFTDEGLCEQIHAFKTEHAQQFEEINEVKKELILSQFFPRKYFELGIEKNQVQGDVTHESLKKNGLVLSIGHPEIEKGAQKKFKKLLSNYKKINRSFLKLMKKKSVEKCQRVKERLKFNYDQYLKAKEELTQFREFTRWQEYKSVNKATRRLLRSKKIKWEIQYGITKKDIVSALSSGKYQHIVLIMHAKDNGFLVDSNSVILPTSLFKNSHPDIESLMLMSCYSDKVTEKYKLAANFLEGKRNIQDRYLITPKSKLTIQDNRSILKVLRFYLKKYRKNVLKKDNLRLKKQTEYKSCQFELKSPLKGGIDLFVNDKIYLGEFINDRNKFETNCANLEGAKYISVRPHPHQAPEFEEIEITGLKLKRHFYFDDKYSGSSFELIKP